MDEDGFVTVTGRTKDLIIRGGASTSRPYQGSDHPRRRQIAPLEIDNVLLSDPRVIEAAAIGVPDDIYGEEIVCYVVVKPGETLSMEDVRRHCAGALADFKVPKAVHFIDDLPKSDRGKIRRDDLKERWARDSASS